MENPAFENEGFASNPNQEKIKEFQKTKDFLKTTEVPMTKEEVPKTTMLEDKTAGSKTENVKRETLMIMKNVVIISFAFMLLFTAFQSMASLQSSINKVMGFSKMHFVLTLLITIKISGKNKT